MGVRGCVGVRGRVRSCVGVRGCVRVGDRVGVRDCVRVSGGRIGFAVYSVMSCCRQILSLISVFIMSSMLVGLVAVVWLAIILLVVVWLTTVQ